LHINWMPWGLGHTAAAVIHFDVQPSHRQTRWHWHPFRGAWGFRTRHGSALTRGKEKTVWALCWWATFCNEGIDWSEWKLKINGKNLPDTNGRKIEMKRNAREYLERWMWDMSKSSSCWTASTTDLARR
jgi:hypothetical protein